MQALTKVRRDCVYCQHNRICIIREGVERSVLGRGVINVNGKGAPGKMEDIFIALARACTEWKPDANSD